MFTLKFYRYYEDTDCSESVCVSSPCYSAYQRSDKSYAITIYKGFVHVDGVEYQVSDNKERNA